MKEHSFGWASSAIFALAILGLLGLLALSSGCVTSGDLARIEQAVEDTNAGLLTPEQLREEIAAVAEGVDERTGDFLDGISTGHPLIDLLLAGGAAVAGAIATRRAAVKRVNEERNAARIARGEPVSTPPKP